MMEDELNIKKEMIVKSSAKIYGRGTCAQSVFHTLTGEQKQWRLASCQEVIQTCQDNPNFLDYIFAFLK
jgi:hypothetical protein